MVAKTFWKGSYLKWVKEQQDRNYYRQMVLTPEDAGITDEQRLMLLPFQIMRRCMENIMLQQLEIATGLYEKQAEEFENALMTYVATKHR